MFKALYSDSITLHHINEKSEKIFAGSLKNYQALKNIYKEEIL